MDVNIGISEKNRQAVANELNKLLADEHILYNKTRNYHWSIEGPSFMEFHKLYEAQYDALVETIDQIAERIRTIGHFAEGRLKELIKLNKSNEIAKVEKTVELYRDTNADAWSRELKEKYYKIAMNHLEEIAVLSARKKPLMELAEYLINREH